MSRLIIFRLTTALAASLGFLGAAYAVGPGATQETLNLTRYWGGYVVSLIVFVVAYVFVMLEETTHMRKSKPVILAAGLICGVIGLIYAMNGIDHVVATAVRHNILEYAELFLFLLVAMTFINAMEERQVFEVLRVKLANAGGAFSPFGDITTLMVWQKGVLQFQDFLVLFLPSVVNWLVPAAIMSFAVANNQPEADAENLKLNRGALVTKLHGLNGIRCSFSTV